MTAPQEQLERQLRQRIGRLRRRIGNRLRSSALAARRLTNWRTYVKRYPAAAIAAALGAGLALSGGLSRRRRLPQRLGARLMRHAGQAVVRLLKQELARLWADSTPRGADHGRK
jgi:hypothetical protein